MVAVGSPDPDEPLRSLDPPSEPEPPSDVVCVVVTWVLLLGAGPPSLVPPSDPEAIDAKPPSEPPLGALPPPELPSVELAVVAPEPPSEPDPVDRAADRGAIVQHDR